MAEAIFRMRQQQADRQARTDQLLAGAARADRSAQHAADRLRWTQASAKQWVQAADLPDLGRAWAAAAGWADTDPTADVAATRVESRLADLAPNAMARFDELRQDGWTRVDAMRAVLPRLAMEDHLRSQDRRVFVAEPGQTTTADAAQARADNMRDVARMDLARPGDPATPRVDEQVDGVGLGRLEQAEAAAWQANADTATSGSTQLDVQGRRVTADGRHAADLAAEAYPRSYTHIHPNITAPAARQTTGPASTTRSLTRGR